MKKRISMVTALALMAATGGYGDLMPEHFTPTKPPKAEPGPEDFERKAKAEAKRKRKASRGW
jgi:hypothetical protein